MHDDTGGAWWRNAVIYELYVQSFADSDGDGLGDLAGVRARLPYLAELGIDAIWFTPWYPSPLADAGYDVADYRDIAPRFGTLAEADALIAQAHRHGIKTIIDVVPNHCSDQHAWFQAALNAPPGSAERERFWFRPGRGPDGDLPPNNWQSRFGGPAWTRVNEPDGEWYLHIFAPQQPDFNWGNPEVRAEFEDILRFWFDRGADGIRIDTAAMLTKDPALPDLDETSPAPHPYVDRDDVHEVYRAWRAIADRYKSRVLIGEIWLADAARLARYTRPDELHTVFNFPYLSCPWDAGRLREVIDGTLASHGPATWVLSNHDVDRHVSRYGRADTSFDLDNRDHSQPVDLQLGTRRARAAALLTMALPGSVYVYQGEELGLWEVEDIPDERRQDPIWQRTGGTDPGRDGSRVPLPWSGVEPPFGFSPASATVPPWLPQPKEWRELTTEAQDADPESMLELYRAALRIRRTWRTAALTWRLAPDGVLAFDRGDGVCCVANLSRTPADLPAHRAVLLASSPLSDAKLPPDTTAWLRF
ncbi:MAG: glycoside hydrolase family 13 protein [Streptosporangiaceae bacterium]|nr:glycoside hydrolase family 13 protein [Streptosporangiaceae bacterium]